MTTSGPATSKTPPSGGVPSARVTQRASSSIQTGWMRWVPGPITGMTGECRAIRAKLANAPPPGPKTKLGLSVTDGIPEPATASSMASFAR